MFIYRGTRVPISRTVRPEEQDLGIWNVLGLSTVPKAASLFERELEGMARGRGGGAEAGDTPSPGMRLQAKPLTAPPTLIPYSKTGTRQAEACSAWLAPWTVRGQPRSPGYLVGGDVRVRREGQHAHGLADLVQLAPFGLTEVFSCVSRKQHFGSSKFAFRLQEPELIVCTQ